MRWSRALSWWGLFCASVMVCAACGPPPTNGDGGDAFDTATDAVDDAASEADVIGPPVQVMMDFTRANGFYDGPFPSEERRLANGHIDMHGFPVGTSPAIITQLVSILSNDVNGFGTTSDIAFRLTGPIDATQLPTPTDSITVTSPVFLVSVDHGAPDYLRRYPVRVRFELDGGPYGARNLLTLLPYQGIPLRENTLYAAVVLRSLHDTVGRPLDIAPNTSALVAGTPVAGLSADASTRYGEALTALGEANVDRSEIAGLAVFRTGEPTRGMRTVREDVLALKRPTIDAPFVRDEVFDEYCVYHSTLPMPLYQGGTPPYSDSGGGWVFDASGHAVVQRTETARIVVTIPRRAMPTNGFPTTVLVRTGAGGDRPLVDRGVQGVAHGPTLVPGSGYAQDFAHAGFAGVQIDGPLGGLRNPTGGDEQFLVFNVGNPTGLRDNVRQSALELILLAHVIENLAVDASDCPGVTASGAVRFDSNTLALMGHSMGATIAPLALAFEPRYRAAILSGAGGSWIENVVYKQSPVPVRSAMELMLRYSGAHRTIDENDIAVSLLQWAGEAADPPVFGRYVIQEPQLGGSPRHVLMVQGIVDTYILPAIANSTSLSFGLDLAGEPLDATEPRLAMFAPLESVLPFSRRHRVTYPVANNQMPTGLAPSTAAVLQVHEDGIEDGHEVAFQTEGPKHQVICYLEGLASGPVRIVAPDMEFAACP